MTSNVAKLMYNQIAQSKEKKPADIMAFNATIESLRKMDGWDKATKQDVTLMRGADELFFHE